MLIYKRRDVWEYRYRDYTGCRRSAMGFKSKKKTLRLAQEVQSVHDEIRRGLHPVVSSAQTEQQQKGISESLRQYWRNTPEVRN